MADDGLGGDPVGAARAAYRDHLHSIHERFDLSERTIESGPAAIAERSRAMDALVGALWRAVSGGLRGGGGVALVAVGGYGRKELFPSSDVDLLFLAGGKTVDREIKDAIRGLSQALWDSGARAAPVTRLLTECERLDRANVESALAMLDARLVCGDEGLFARLTVAQEKLLLKDGRLMMTGLAELTETRHGKYGGTLFHLEPNVKDCPGGLRDVHLCKWMARLQSAGRQAELRERAQQDFTGEFAEAFGFLATVRCFLHYRRERDDNTLDWQAQDEAAALSIGAGADAVRGDPSYWMRVYFRHARIVSRRALQAVSEVPVARGLRLPRLGRAGAVEAEGYRVEQGRAHLRAGLEGGGDPAREPHVVLGLFVAMAQSGFTLTRETEDRLSQALPAISSDLEEGPELWDRVKRILTGTHAGDTLRAMHALGLLELLFPEFHGIDALVVRDAYHRYTVDEHTFVLIDTLHGLGSGNGGRAGEWEAGFVRLLKDLQHPELLYLAALLHDTGKGRSTGLHAVESERLARSVLRRLELDGYETEQVATLVRHHLEMSATLRRDIFDAETVRGFAAKVPTPDALRMMTLFTYADIHAVHPDALTPWKAENLWRLYMATANYLDRIVDEDRVSASGGGGELFHRIVIFAPGRSEEVRRFLDGFPERYLRTRTPEEIWTHFQMAARFSEDPVQLDFVYHPAGSRITLVTVDRELLFATVAGVLAAWGMDIVTADGFSNAHGIVVDSFRFTDAFRTLEMNESERGVFVRSVRRVLAGEEPVEKLLAVRRGRRKAPMVAVTPRVDFDAEASTHSTLVQVVAHDTPGLLRALSVTFAQHGCNVEVALVDTEGERAIDVFYLTKDRMKLDVAEQTRLRDDLVAAIEANNR